DADSTSDIDDTDEAKSLSPKTSTSEPSALGQISDHCKASSEMNSSLVIRLTDCLSSKIGIVMDNRNIKNYQSLVVKLSNCLKEEIGSIENEKTEAGTAQCAEYNEKEESSELLNCNVDTSESLLDITMEEILSDSQKVGETAADSQNTIILDYDDIKPKLEIIKIEDTELEESKPLVMNQNNIGDEILELLKEVPIPCLENTNVTAKSPSVEDASDEQTEADNILKMLEQDSFDDSSESYNDDDIHLWSDSSIDDVAEKVIDLSENKLQQALKQNDMADCYVEIERLQLPEKDLIKYTRKLEDDVDWLCDLGNLHKRKFDISLPFEKFKRVKKKHRGKSSTSRNSFDTSDSSNDSDVELCGYRSGTPLLPKPIGQKLDDFIANGICRDLRSSSSSSSDGSGDDTDSSTKKKSRSNVDNETDTEEGSGKDKNNRRKELSKEELRKKAWKHDPLLRGKLSSSSDSSGSDVSKAKRKRQRYEHDTEFTVASENLDESDSDMADMCEKNKSKLEEKLISPIKRNLPSSDSSDSDSDCEFVSQKMRSPLKDGDAAGPGPSQKGRRNIRALMSQELLAEATKKANKEEMERIERLKDRNKVIESFSQSFTNSQSSLEEDAVPPFVLDFDNKTGEPLIQVHEKITALLKPHQRKGVQFMWDSCYESVDQLQKHEGSGCILGHCMGLGKTLQVLTLIHTLFTHEVTNTKHVLVVCPLSTVNNWKKERKFAWKGIPEAENISVLTIVKQRTEDRFDIVKKWRRTNKKSILVLGYETFQTLTNETKMNNMNLRTKKQILEALIDPGPDLVICDEGHLLRNKDSLKALALIKIRSQRRIVLTGTPLQNNLLEYYHMVEIVKPNLLGNIKEFQTNFINPITNGQYEDSTEGDIKLMMKRTHVLHRLLAKTIQRIEDTELEIYLPKMMDHAVFIRLNQLQVNLYNHFSDIAKENMDKKQHKGFLSDFLIFQHICTHPHLLALVANKNRKTKRIEEDIITIEEEKPLKLGNWWKDKVPKDADSKIEYGNKLVVLRSIIEECEDIEDKVLVFSQCLSELDLIEHFLNTVGTRKCPSWKKKVDYSRMDGTVSIEDRSLICDIFNDTENVKMRLLLMSTKVGGLGLNLTAANRVIIMTVNWNPSYDTQSVFRVYRFGQQKEVFVYRLIALDTMEEKVYQRSVTKLAIAHRVVDQHQITRHYPRKQELYSCRPSADEERPMPKLPEDQMLAKLLFQLPCIYRCHEHKALLANRPEDNLSADELASAWDAWLNNENANPALPRVQIAPPPEAQRQPPSGTLAQRQPPPSTLAQRYPAPGALLQRYIPPGSRLLVMPPPGTLAQRHHPPGTLAQIQPPPSRHPSWTQARRHRSPWTLVQRHPSPGTLAQRHPPPLIPTQRLPSSITSPPVPNAKETLCMFENSFRSNQVPSRRVSDSSREDNSREYFTPTSKIGTPSADIPNRENIKLPSKEKLKSIPSTNVNLQSTTDTGQQFVINSVEHAAIIDQILAMSKAEFEVNKDSRVGVQLSPTIPEANRISIASEDISRLSSNLSGPSLGGKQQRSGPLTSGGTNVHKNTNKTPLMVMDRKLVQSPFDVGIKNVPNPFSRNMPKQNRPNNTPSGARDGGSVQKPGPSTGLNKKGIPQRVGRALKGGEPIKKKPTNENSVPTPQRRNITNKRKYEEIADKKRKNSSQLPSSGNQAHQVVNADYRPNPCKKNRISSNENSQFR
ncbi:Protein CHROMATIN REMODELING 20, partial [Gonioctena quinquepunctata]